MRAALWAVVILGMLRSVAICQTQPAITGQGTKSCAEVTTDYRKYPQVAGSLYQEWAQGFMAGFNLSLTADHLPVRDTAKNNPFQQERELRHLCEQNPSKSFWEIVLQYFMALPAAH